MNCFTKHVYCYISAQTKIQTSRVHKPEHKAVGHTVGAAIAAVVAYCTPAPGASRGRVAKMPDTS
jgi:hypothetical protein